MNKLGSTTFVAFGGNLGDPISTLKQALPMLRDRIGEIQLLSSLYETKALTLHGEVHQNYINAVIEIVSEREPIAILNDLLAIERELGRERSPGKRWEPRTIDLDLLFVGDAVITTSPLTLPHPEMTKRDFVLKPLVEIAPDFVHPVLAKTMRELDNLAIVANLETFVLRTFPFPG